MLLEENCSVEEICKYKLQAFKDHPDSISYSHAVVVFGSKVSGLNFSRVLSPKRVGQEETEYKEFCFHK